MKNRENEFLHTQAIRRKQGLRLAVFALVLGFFASLLIGAINFKSANLSSADGSLSSGVASMRTHVTFSAENIQTKDGDEIPAGEALTPGSTFDLRITVSSTATDLYWFAFDLFGVGVVDTSCENYFDGDALGLLNLNKSGSGVSTTFSYDFSFSEGYDSLNGLAWTPLMVPAANQYAADISDYTAEEYAEHGEFYGGNSSDTSYGNIPSEASFSYVIPMSLTEDTDLIAAYEENGVIFGVPTGESHVTASYYEDPEAPDYDYEDEDVPNVGNIYVQNLFLKIRNLSDEAEMKSLKIASTTITDADFTASATDETQKTYTYKHSTDAKLDALKVTPKVSDGASLTLSVNNTSSASPATSGTEATLDLSSTVTEDSKAVRKFVYVVTAETGENSTTYTVYVVISYVSLDDLTAEPVSVIDLDDDDCPWDTDISDTYKGLSPEFDKDTTTYSIYVPYDSTDTTNYPKSATVGATVLDGFDSDTTITVTASGCTASASSFTSKGSITVSSITTDSYVKLTATAQDGETTKDYTVNFVLVDMAAKITAFDVTGVKTQPGGGYKTYSDSKTAEMTDIDFYFLLENEEADNYKATLNITYTGDSIKVMNSSNTEVTGYDATPCDAGTYTITVTAEAGNTKVYTFKMNEPKNNDATLKSLALEIKGIDPADSSEKSTQVTLDETDSEGALKTVQTYTYESKYPLTSLAVTAETNSSTSTMTREAFASYDPANPPANSSITTEATSGVKFVYTIDASNLTEAGGMIAVLVTAEDEVTKIAYYVVVKVGYVRLDEVVATVDRSGEGLVEATEVGMKGDFDPETADTTKIVVNVPSDSTTATVKATIVSGFGILEDVSFTATNCKVTVTDTAATTGTFKSGSTVTVGDFPSLEDLATAGDILVKLEATAADGVTKKAYLLQFVILSVEVDLESVDVTGMDTNTKYENNETKATNASVAYYFLVTDESTTGKGILNITPKDTDVTIDILDKDSTKIVTYDSTTKGNGYESGEYVIKVTAPAGNTKTYKVLLAKEEYLQLTSESAFMFLYQNKVSATKSYRRGYTEDGQEQKVHGTDDKGWERIILGNIPDRTSISVFVSNIAEDQRDKIYLYNAKNKLVYADGTFGEGMKATDLTNVTRYSVGTGWKLTFGGTQESPLDTVYLSVLGDLSGDGIINATDLSKVKAYLVKHVALGELEYTLAAYVKNSGTINATDFNLIKTHILAKTKISKNYLKVATTAASVSLSGTPDVAVASNMRREEIVVYEAPEVEAVEEAVVEEPQAEVTETPVVEVPAAEKTPLTEKTLRVETPVSLAQLKLNVFRADMFYARTKENLC